LSKVDLPAPFGQINQTICLDTIEASICVNTVLDHRS